MMEMSDAQSERQRRLNDNIPNFLQSDQLSKQDAAMAKLSKGLETAAAYQNAALGMTPAETAAPPAVDTPPASNSKKLNTSGPLKPKVRHG